MGIEKRLSEVELSLTRLAGGLGARLDSVASSLDASEAAAQSSADFMQCTLAEFLERLPTRTATHERATQVAVSAASQESQTDGGMEADQAAGGAGLGRRHITEVSQSVGSCVADSLLPPPAREQASSVASCTASQPSSQIRTWPTN